MKLKSDSIVAVTKALLAAQKAIGKVAKDGYNPHFKSNYADLPSVIEAVKDPLNSNDICFLQLIGMPDDMVGGNPPYVETVLLHISGEWISSVTPIYCLKPNNPQAMGTGISYAKRYALQAIMGLPTEDDDGNAAVGKPNSNQTNVTNNNENQTQGAW